MKKIAAAKFKEQCLALMDNVGPEGILITKRGKPVARLVPVGDEPRQLLGSLSKKIRIKGDLKTTGLRWNADVEP